MIRYFIISLSIFLVLTVKAYSDVKMQIISNLEKATNYDFKFTQQINKKRETGNCILVFDKKINCRYDKTAKILVSDGKNLVIKNKNSNISNFYKLENTSFYKLLDKKYLINELTKNEIKNEYEKLFIDLNYQNIKIKIFFDKEKLLLNGWETTDIYNNYVLTEIKIRKINKTFDENLFNLNKFN